MSRWRAFPVIYALSFIPPSLFALKLLSPNVSLAGIPPTVNVVWAEETGDPSHIDLQIICGSSAILDSSVHTETSPHEAFIRGDSTWEKRLVGTCHIQARDGSRKFLTSPEFLGNDPTSSTSILSATPGTQPTSGSLSRAPNRSTLSQVTPSRISSESLTTINHLPSSDASSIKPSDTTAPETSITGPTIVNVPETTINIPSSGTNPSISTGNPVESPSHTSSPVVIIGGAIGGLVLLVLILVSGFLYLRRIRPCKPPTHFFDLSNDEIKNVPGKSSNMTITEALSHHVLPSLFRNHDILDITAHPAIVGEDYRQPEGKRERLHRVREEMNDARRRRDVLRSNLSIQNRRNAGYKGPYNDLEGPEREERLREELECMSNRIAELEAQLTEMTEPPPGYISSNHR